MNTKYGEMNESLFVNYKERLIGKVFKLLPLKENENETLDKYLESLLFELVGAKRFVDELGSNPDFLSFLMCLEGLYEIKEFPMYRRKVFECINIIKKL